MTSTANYARSALHPIHLLVLSIGTFTLGVDGFVLSGLLPRVARSLHVTVSAAGQLTTLFALVYAVGSPLVAALASDWDRRTLLTVGMGVFTVGIVTQALGPSFAVVAAGRVVAALGAAAYQATAYSMAGMLSSDASRARSLAVVAGGSSVALVAGLPFGVLIGQSFGWRTAMWVLVALAVSSTICIRLLPSAHAPALGLRERIGALTDRRVTAVLVGTVTTLTPVFLVLAYLPELVPGAKHWVIVATLVYGCGQVAGTTAVPLLITRRGPRVAVTAGALGALAASVVLILSRDHLAPVIVTIAVLGVAAGSLIVPQQTRLFATVPTLAPIAVGLNGSSIYLGSAVGAAVGGIGLDLGGTLALSASAAVIAALGVAAIVLLAPEDRSTHKTEAPTP